MQAAVPHSMQEPENGQRKKLAAPCSQAEQEAILAEL
jgi:hypothetical protein